MRKIIPVAPARCSVSGSLEAAANAESMVAGEGEREGLGLNIGGAGLVFAGGIKRMVHAPFRSRGWPSQITCQLLATSMPYMSSPVSLHLADADSTRD